MGQFEAYDAPPPYSSAPVHQVPGRYGPPPGSPPSLRTTTYNNSPYTGSGSPYAGSPYGSRQTYNAIPEEYQAMAEVSPSTSQADEKEVDEIAAHYRQYITPAPSGGGFFSTSSPAPPIALTRPILIPQAFAAGFHQPPPPFLRAYPPVLGAREINIPPALFVAILDALNLCLAPPPPLQALELVGQGVGLVPHHIAQGVSAGLGVVAGVGVAATRITKKKKFLARVNTDVFAPRGLVMEVVKDEAALRLVGVSAPSLGQPPTPIGSGAPGAPCTPGGGPGLNAAVQTRLIQLAPYTAPLSFNVPPAAVPTSLMDRISARQTASRLAKDAKRGEKQQQKRDDKMRKLEGRMDRRSSPSSDSDDDSIFSSSQDGASHIHAKADSKRQAAEQKGDWKEVAKIEKKRAKELEDFHKKQWKQEGKHYDKHEDKHQRKYDKNMRKMDKKEHKQEEKDQKKMGKLEWIVIRSRS